METIIAGLLKQFEDGKMTRRQLIQSLAIAAVAAAPASSVAAQSASAISPAAAPAPWKTVWLDHSSYAVSDYRRSTAFYRDLMGWTIRNDNGTSQCTLDINGIGGIIIRNRRAPAEGQPVSTAQGGARAPLTGVINHISWGVQPWDTEKVKAEREKRGLS